jgi:hypothetical protein
VILKGNETFFNMPGAAQRGFSLELEDAVTVSPKPRSID